MNKIVFSDLYKFLTSLGLILIGIALLLPWFINQNSTLILLDEEKINNLTPVAKRIIMHQQNYLHLFSDYLIPIAMLLILLGIVLLIIGICSWRKRQSWLDEIEKEELKAKQMQNLSMQEREKDKEKEIFDLSQNTDIEPDKKQSVIKKYIAVEDSIFEKISIYYSKNYLAKSNIRIRNYEYDIILESRYNINNREDFIFEVKYYSGNISYEKLLDACKKLLLSTNQYEDSLKRKSTPILIIIYSELKNEEQLTLFKNKLREFAINNNRDLRINSFSENSVSEITPPALLLNN